MELKEYQKDTLSKVKLFLEALTQAREEYNKIKAAYPSIASSIHYPKIAWDKVIKTVYIERHNGLNEPLPDFYLKIPTGGGKTLLACHTIDYINKIYLKKQTGLILWIVPSTQIYRQTLSTLQNREHPYRQALDISSGGRTLILEKKDMFTKLDIQESLVILLLMLPSANRQNKETLKVFKDRGGFADFFPQEEHYEEQAALLNEIPNLDYYGQTGEFFGRIIKTSLGNTLKLLKPVIIIDEGHKAYSETARQTIRNFNPSVVVELSATPPPNSNRLVEISGKELNDEEMIKLDLHLINKATFDWKDTMLVSLERRDYLEKCANEYKANMNIYIRPINLIQVERTGKDQRGTRFIHAEDVKEYLTKKCGVPVEHIAIKSSEKDDIEGIDLLSDRCQIRYIITKQALQEGWDCPFAYVLTVLTNPASEVSITQLVGRILRQPYARKTKVKALDESYVFTYRPNATELVKNIKAGLESEGLSDIAGRISLDSENSGSDVALKEKEISYREEFRKFAGKIYLPKFVVQERDSWRDLNYDVDILGKIDWAKINLSLLKEVTLAKNEIKDQEVIYGIGGTDDLLQEHNRLVLTGTLEIDYVFLTRQILDIVPNPWVAFDIGKKAINIFLTKDGKDQTASNFVFIIEELRKVLEKERDRLAEKLFRSMLTTKKLYFFLLAGNGNFVLPKRISLRSSKGLVREDNSSLKRSLLDYVPVEGLNDMEQTIAVYLDEQEKLLWWYRNISRQDYNIQGWKRHKIYPDFIAAAKEKGKTAYGSIFVIESKGLHLSNEDTQYKSDVFKMCNELGVKIKWNDLGLKFPEQKFEFQVIFEDEWKSKINKMLL